MLLQFKDYPAMHRDDSNDNEQRVEPSRSQRRREALDVLHLAQTLADLSAAQLAPLPLPDGLREEVLQAHGVRQQIARKRQIQFLAKQLRKLDDDELEPIRAMLEHRRAHARREAIAMHRVESWRDRLIAEGDEALNDLLHEHPQLDRQHLRQLSRQARAERDRDRPPHAQRALYRELRRLFGA